MFVQAHEGETNQSSPHSGIELLDAYPERWISYSRSNLHKYRRGMSAFFAKMFANVRQRSKTGVMASPSNLKLKFYNMARIALLTMPSLRPFHGLSGL